MNENDTPTADPEAVTRQRLYDLYRGLRLAEGSTGRRPRLVVGEDLYDDFRRLATVPVTGFGPHYTPVFGYDVIVVHPDTAVVIP